VRVWLCEKKDQADKLAPLLGKPRPARGYIDTADGRVTWAIGHLLQQAQPEQYDTAWGQWQFDVLPMLPQRWQLLPDPNKQQQLDAVLACLKAASEVVIATDCGQEGEAIARELLDYAGYRGAVRRLWYSALDEGSLRKALAGLREDAASRPLYWAAQARARADWLIGMNLSRAYTLRARASGAKEVRSVGRVQTPTLALVVRRDREIESFVPRTYYSLEAEATTATGERVTLRYAPPEASRLWERPAAEALAQQLAGATGPLQVEQAEKTQAPPKLLNLTRLSTVLGRKYGWKSDYTLEIAQRLYEKELTTYPRTACTLLPNEQEGDVPAVLDALTTVPALARHVAALVIHPPLLRKSVFNTAKMAEANHEHHAIIPTAASPQGVDMSDDERAAYLIIAQHYLAALMPDYRYAETRLSLEAAGVTLSAVGRVPLDQGWRHVFGAADPDAEDGPSEDVAGELPAIAAGTRMTLGQPAIKAHKTTPPKRYTDAELLADMESVAKYATDPAIKARLKETSGIGTPATRAAIIKTLRERGYIADQGKHIVSTPLGRELVDTLPAPLTDPATTAVWEERLDELRQGKLPESARDEFVARIAENITRLIERVRAEASAVSAARPPTEAQLRYARTIAEALQRPLPPEATASYSALQAYITAHQDAFAALPPTPAQLAFAEKIAAERGIELPAEARTQRAACGAWLDLHAPKPQGRASSGKAKGRAGKGARRAPKGRA
jgi:DNA topoisomerase-3